MTTVELIKRLRQVDFNQNCEVVLRGEGILSPQVVPITDVHLAGDVVIIERPSEEIDEQ